MVTCHVFYVRFLREIQEVILMCPSIFHRVFFVLELV
jgi:hypothetical protein